MPSYNLMLPECAKCFNAMLFADIKTIKLNVPYYCSPAVPFAGGSDNYADSAL